MSIAFVFPGQGAQYIGMAKEICSQYPKSAEIFKLASEALKIDMEEMVFNGDEETLKITENTQPAILTASIACLQPILDAGIEAAYTAGLSLGEYAAHVYSGTFTFSEAVKLVKKTREVHAGCCSCRCRLHGCYCGAWQGGPAAGL